MHYYIAWVFLNLLCLLFTYIVYYMNNVSIITVYLSIDFYWQMQKLNDISLNFLSIFVSFLKNWQHFENKNRYVLPLITIWNLIVY